MSPSNAAWAPLGPSPSGTSSDVSDDTTTEESNLLRGKLRAAIEAAAQQPATVQGIMLLERVLMIFETLSVSAASPKRKSRDWLDESADESAGSIAPCEFNFTTLHNLKQLISRKREELLAQQATRN